MLAASRVRPPSRNFLNPDELVRGHIILNDSKAASRDVALKKGCVRANACKEPQPTMLRTRADTQFVHSVRSNRKLIAPRSA